MLLNDIEDLEVYREVSLKHLTTFRIGGTAQLLVYPRTIASFVKVLKRLRDEGISYRILGGGSNLLVDDRGVDEVVISTTKLKGYSLSGNSLEVEAGVSLSSLISLGVREGLAGLEELGGIPGTVGGAIVGNAGANGRSIGELLTEALVFIDGILERLTADEIRFSYRSSSLRSLGGILLKAKLRLVRGDGARIKARLLSYLKKRKETQPLEYPSAGSVFKNPSPSLRAWKLVDEVGMRGYRIGDAVVSHKHANFILNLGEATFDDVMFIIEEIKRKVREKFRVVLEEEIQIWKKSGRADLNR